MNTQQGMQMLSLSNEVLQDLLASNQAAAILLNREFIASENELIQAVYNRCQNIAKVYGLNFSVKLEPELEVICSAIHQSWIISEDRAKNLQSIEEKQVAFSMQSQLELSLEQDVQQPPLDCTNSNNNVEFDKSTQEYEDKLYGNFVKLDWQSSSVCY